MHALDKRTTDPAVLQRTRAELTVSPLDDFSFGNNNSKPNKQFSLFVENAKRLYVPRPYAAERFGLADPLPVLEGMKMSNDVTFAGDLRDAQKEPVEAALAAARDPRRGGGVLSLPCGFGKTTIAIYLACTLQLRTLILVHKDFLLHQWRERIDAFAPGASIGLIKAKVLDVQGKDFVLASVQSLSMKNYDSAIFRNFGMVVIDEVHHMGAEVFSRALAKIASCPVKLGLSATVDRRDGLSKVFLWHLGPVLYEAASRTDTVRVVILKFTSNDPAYAFVWKILGTGKVNTARMINNITSFAPRSELIADHIVRAFRESNRTRRILVLSDRKAQLAQLAALLTQRDASMTHGFYVGGMSKSDLAASMTRDVMLATYLFASEGFDAPHLDTLVMASPKSNVQQSVGRILRVKAGEPRRNVPLVIDVADDLFGFHGQARKRNTYYVKSGYDIERCREDREEVLEVETGNVDMDGMWSEDDE